MLIARPLAYATALVAGFAVMAAEMCAGRLMAPFFGTSTMVWALLIGSVMLSLSAGYLLGGRLSQRRGAARWLFVGLLIAAAILAVLPWVARPVMRGSLSLFQDGAMGTLLASAIGVTALFAVPLVALGAASPLLLHHSVGATDQTGVVAGRLYALSTVGSLLGTFLSGVVLVPLLGSDATLRLCAGLLAANAIAALVHPRWRLLGAIPPVVALAALALPPATIKDRPHGVFETESAYNYIQVTDNGRQRRLFLNDGYAVQSTWHHDGSLSLESVWGYYALSPAWTATGEPERILLLGLGGGSSARFFAHYFATAEVTGVELDPEIVAVARDYFELPPSTQVVIDDARAFLHRATDRYDIIIVDAFQFPYIPFQLTTREFYADLDRHLAPGGVVVVNVGRDRDAFAVVDAISQTLQSVFAHLQGVDLPNGANTILVAAQHAPARAAGLAGTPLPEPMQQRLSSLPPARPRLVPADAPVLTDNLAPVELLTDQIVVRRLLERLFGPSS